LEIQTFTLSGVKKLPGGRTVSVRCCQVDVLLEILENLERLENGHAPEAGVQ